MTAVEVVAVLDVVAAASLAGLSLIGSDTKVPVAGHATTTATTLTGSGSAASSTTAAPTTTTPTTTSATPTTTNATPAGATTTSAAPASAARTGAAPAGAARVGGAPASATRAGKSSLPGRPHAPAAHAKGPSPVLLAISPSSSGPGQSVTLEGKGFFSPDGHITVLFGARPAPVYCPSETTCHVTVPGPPGAGTVTVTVQTEAGASNALSFTYAAAPLAPRAKRRG